MALGWAAGAVLGISYRDRNGGKEGKNRQPNCAPGIAWFCSEQGRTKKWRRGKKRLRRVVRKNQGDHGSVPRG